MKKFLLPLLLLLANISSAQIPVSVPFQFNAPRLPDTRTAPIVNGVQVPYPSVAAANAGIIFRAQGLPVLINDGSGMKEYWYVGGTADTNLKLKTVAITPYTLPVATANTLGGVRQGSNINIDQETGLSLLLSALPIPCRQLLPVHAAGLR